MNRLPNPFFVTTGQALSFLVMWPVAMGWHLWRVLTFRPAFKKISDSTVTTASFVAVYFGAGWLRWAVLGDSPGMTVILSLMIWAIVLGVLCLRKRRSNSLWLCMLASSAAVDLTASMLQTLGINVNESVGFGVEVALYVRTYLVFRALHLTQKGAL